MSGELIIFLFIAGYISFRIGFYYGSEHGFSTLWHFLSKRGINIDKHIQEARRNNELNGS